MDTLAQIIVQETTDDDGCLVPSVPVYILGTDVSLDADLGPSEEHIGEVTGRGKRVSTEFTRPNDTSPYSGGDVVSNSTSATTLIALQNAFRVAGGSAYIVRASLVTDKKSVTPRFRVHLFNASNPTVAADNVAHKELYSDQSKRLGFFDLPNTTTAQDASSSDMSRSMDNTLRHMVIAADDSTSLYALLEAIDGFTPSAQQKFTLTLFLDQN